MRILLAPDKFKGSLSGSQAARALAEGFRAGLGLTAGELETECLPVADGGEGTAEALCDALGGRWVERTVLDPLGRPVAARYALVEPAAAAGGDGGERPLAVIEMSLASGFGLVRGDERDLLRANTFGTGELLRHALRESGARRVLVGIGGSATNDGGVGLAAALGYRFLDAAGRELPPGPGALTRLARIEPPLPGAVGEAAAVITVASDVTNPLLGPRGATRVYGPQKGLKDDAERDQLEAALARLADVTAATVGRDHRHDPGAGAAGGLGFGLLAFCHATLRPGFGVVAELLGLDAAVARADLVVTGEGSLDGQTLEGKAPAGVAALARRHGKPCVAFAGRIAGEADQLAGLAAVFDAVFPLAPAPMSLAECQTRAAELLVAAATRASGWLHVGRRLSPRFPPVVR